MDKPIDWRGSSLDDLRAFPETARKMAGQLPEIEQKDEQRRRSDRGDAVPSCCSRKDEIRMTIDIKSRHRTKAGGNVFQDLGFSPKQAKRLLAQTDAQIDESIRLKQQLMDEIAGWMKETSVTQAAAAEVLRVTRPRVSDVGNHKVE